MILAREVDRYVSSRPALQKALALGIINHAALARRIGKAMGSANHAAIAAALRRLEPGDTGDRIGDAVIMSRSNLLLLEYGKRIVDAPSSAVLIAGEGATLIAPASEEETLLSSLGEPKRMLRRCALVTVERVGVSEVLGAICTQPLIHLASEPGRVYLLVGEGALGGILAALSPQQNLY